MRLFQLPYPSRLYAEMLIFAFYDCEKTKGKTAAEVKEMLAAFFDDADIDKAIGFFTGQDVPL
jgi:hypothetical protein